MCVLEIQNLLSIISDETGEPLEQTEETSTPAIEFVLMERLAPLHYSRLLIDVNLLEAALSYLNYRHLRPAPMTADEEQVDDFIG